MIETPAMVMMGPIEPGGWALQAEFYGNFKRRSPGVRLDNRRVALWLSGLDKGPGLDTPRHTPYVVLSAPEGLSVELDEQDRQTLREAAAGYSAKIAAVMNKRSPAIIQGHRESVMSKFDACSMQDAVTRAVVLSELEVTPEVGHRRTMTGRGVQCLGLCSIGYPQAVASKIAGGDENDNNPEIAPKAMQQARRDLATPGGRLTNRIQVTHAAFAQGILVVGPRYRP